MIENPLSEQVMQEMDRVHLAWELEELCKDHAHKLATDNFVYEELIGDFQDWFYLYFLDHSEDDEYVKSLPDDKDLIDEWWEEIGDHYDEYDSPYDIDPTPSADCPYSDAEYIITAEERSQIAFEQKLRDKG